jgi:hypothetical protein
MKQTKSILLAAIAAAAVGSATAQTTNVVPRNQINLAGSTAFRSVHLKELHNYAVGQGFTLVASDASPSAGTGSAALYSKVISSRTNNGVVTQTCDFINARFVGSEGGTLITGNTSMKQGFYGLRQSGVGTSPTSVCTNRMGATITYSDCDQRVGVFNTVTGKITAKANTLTKAGDLPAINFAFCTTKDFPADNITARQAQALWRRGHLPLSFFTGNPNDRTNGVFAIGRNLDSGTRTAILAEIGLGSLAKVNQYDFNTNTRVVSLTQGGTNLPGISFANGDGGDDSGGTLTTKIAAAINLVGTNVVTIPTNTASAPNYTGKVYLIGYSGAPDISGKALKALSYNGTAPYHPSPNANTLGFQTNFNGIANGTYTLFSIGKVYFSTLNMPSATGRDTNQVRLVATALANNINTNSSSTFGSGHTALGSLLINPSRVEGSAPVPR